MLSNKQSFLITVTTKEKYSGNDYKEQTGRMLNVFTDIFTDAAQIASITKNAPLTASNLELEISQPLNETLRAIAVLDVECEKRVILEKNKLTALFKSLAPKWAGLKLEKRSLVEIPDSAVAAGLEEAQ